MHGVQACFGIHFRRLVPMRGSLSPSTQRGLNWLLLVTAVGVVLIAAQAVNSLGRRADSLRHMETSLARLEEAAHELNALEWETMHRGRLTPDHSQKVQNARGKMQRQIERLRELDATAEDLVEVMALFEDYSKLVDREFQLLGQGEIKEAEEWDEHQVDPAFDRLGDAMNEASSRFDQLAAAALTEVNRWTYLILAASAMAVGLLFWQYHQKQHAMELSLVEQRVLRESNEELEERVRQRTAELAALNKQILASARQAGMAEVANSVLHNVGNALNSVNVSVSLCLETLSQTCLADLPAAASLVEQHQPDLAGFLTRDERGRQFPRFLRSLAEQSQAECTLLNREIGNLSQQIQHVREIVQRQQAISGVSGILEQLSLAEVVADALSLTEEPLREHRIEVRCEIPADTVVHADRSKLMQILVNLVTNASQALAEGRSEGRWVQLRSDIVSQSRVRLEVSDNGPGIAKENLTRIFSYGFTTKPTGHGFGVHGSAVAMQEMGGSLEVRSEGKGKGATFILDIAAVVPPAEGMAA